METLLAGGAEVNAADATGWTPLHLAARWGRVRAARVLLAAGADVNAKTAIGHTPLDWAAVGAGGGGRGEAGAGRGGRGDAVMEEVTAEDVEDVLIGAGGVRALGEGQSVWETFCRGGVGGVGAGGGREGDLAGGVNVFQDLTGEVLLRACSVLGVMLCVPAGGCM